MTVKDSANGVLGDIISACATTTWKIANYVQNGCGLTYTISDLQKFENLWNEVGPLYASNFRPVFKWRFSNVGVATTQICRLPKENANQIKEGDHQTDPQTNKRSKFAKWTLSEAAAARATGKLKRVSKSDDVHDGCRRDVDELIRRDLDKSDNE